MVETACERLFKKANAAQFGVSGEQFRAILLAIGEQYAPGVEEQDLVRFLESLKTEELALARGCAAGNEKAWEVFLGRYRATLYSAAYSVAKDERSAKELADSLYAELYGLPRKSGERVSKLEYYRGRGSLEGWLRTVVAQEFVNRYRRTKHEVSLEEKVEAGAQFEAPTSPEAATGSELESATAKAMSGLEAEERFLLAAYFLDGRTLAEIGRTLRVHESTISRKLERVTSGLRKAIRKELLAGGMSSRQADEMMQDLDVRDLNVNVRANLQQETGSNAFYKSNE
ncbi:MAG TPA: sigma-70 family RNA polymerase sigma factor [Terriglobales bacterium]